MINLDEAHSPAAWLEVKMKVALLCCVLLLAGSASCSPVEANSIGQPNISIPDWILDPITGVELPEAIQNIIDRLPDIIAAIPDLIDRIREVVNSIIDRLPELIPVIIDKLPDIIAQVPAVIERIREILETIIERLPELIPIILEKIPEIIAAIPIESIREILEKIREVLEGLDLPDWFPTLPDLEKPEWWPPTLPELPEYNRPTPGVPTSVEEFPGIVQIEVGTAFIWAQGCVGSVLTSFHILSSARCFTGNLYDDRFRRVRAGSSTRYDNGFLVGIEGALNHPGFTGGDSDSDITIVRLLTNLVLGSTIQQTAIVPQGFTLPDGIGVTLVGWGSTAQGRVITNRDLHKIDLVTANSECAERWSAIPFISITNNMLCVADPQYGGRNGDIRDMGAPVYYQGILVGVNSFGAIVGNQYFPTVSTAIGSYTDWIVANAN